MTLRARLAQTDYPQRRGLSAATCARFHLGYDPAWRNPKAPETVPPSPRLIIPTGRTSYLARDVRGKDELSEQEARYTKVKVGKTRLFNAEALDTAEKPVFIVEGEIDAMSIVEAGGEAVAYGIWNAQERGQLFIEPGVEVYAGMVVGICSRNEDMTVNVCKKKQLTNMRAAGADEALRLTPPRILSLEQCLEFLADDELLECTPKSLRIRKRELDHAARMRNLMKKRAQDNA